MDIDAYEIKYYLINRAKPSLTNFVGDGEVLGGRCDGEQVK